MNDEIAAIENFYQWLLRKDYTIARYVEGDTRAISDLYLTDIDDDEISGRAGFNDLLREFEREHYDTLD